MTPKRCKHRHCLIHWGYMVAVGEAKRRLRTGWRQKKCQKCQLYYWVKPSQEKKETPRRRHGHQDAGGDR